MALPRIVLGCAVCKDPVFYTSLYTHVYWRCTLHRCLCPSKPSTCDSYLHAHVHRLQMLLACTSHTHPHSRTRKKAECMCAGRRLARSHVLWWHLHVHTACPRAGPLAVVRMLVL